MRRLRLRQAGGPGAAAYLSFLSASAHLVQEIRGAPMGEVSIKTKRLILGLIDTDSSDILHQETLIIHEKACNKLGFDL